MEEWERLLNQLRAEFIMREQELELLHEIDLRLLASERSSKDLFTFIVYQTKKLLHASNCAILLRRGTFLEPMYATLKSVQGQRIAISRSLTGLCLQTDTLVNVPNIPDNERDERYTPYKGYRGSKMLSMLATPIRIRNIPVGVLNTESKFSDAFSPVHERIVSGIAAQVAIALQRTQTLDSSILLADVDRLMFASDDSQHVIQVALERVMGELQRLEHVRHSRADIMFVRGTDELEIVNSTNPKDIGLTLHVTKSVTGRAVRERETIIVGDVSEDSEYQQIGAAIRSEIAVPILFGEDDVAIGVLNVESEDQDAFYGSYQIVLESFAEKVKTLLAFAKLRADVTDTLELRSADDLLAAVGDQTSHMIHRLNNTVGAMRMQIIELQDQQNNGSPTNEEFLRGSLESLRNLAERILKMPDEITQQLGQNSTNVDVNDAVRHALELLEGHPDVEIQVTLDEDIPKLPLFCFDIVVQNLIQNGIDAIPEAGKLSISTSIVRHPTTSTGYFQLIVGDTGAGMPADIRSKVFDLNFSTKRERGKGLGLGLWWVRNFVRRARGDITIRSTVGIGTEVTVKIPLDRPEITSGMSSESGHGPEEAER
jgi:signal transduction histidine kinase